MAKRSRTALERADQTSRLRTRPARAQMLAAARELATARGYEALRAGDIAQAAGVSRETFYTHFADKRSCLAEATGPRLGEIESELRIAAEEEQSWAAPILATLEATLTERYGSKTSARGRIVEAMLGLVAEHGYASVRLADVIKRAHVSYPSFYRHFKGKAECFSAACESLIAGLSERLQEELAPDASQPARLIGLAGLLAADPATARVLAIEAEQLPSQNATHLSAALAGLLGADAGAGAPASAPPAPIARQSAATPLLDSRRLLAGAFAELLRRAVLTASLERLAADLAALTPHLAGAAGQGERKGAPEPRRGLPPRPHERRGATTRRPASTTTTGITR